MTEAFIPKAGNLKVGGLGRAAQKLQATKDKLEQAKGGAKPSQSASALSVKPKTLAGSRKTSFQRKAV